MFGESVFEAEEREVRAVMARRMIEEPIGDLMGGFGSDGFFGEGMETGDGVFRNGTVRVDDGEEMRVKRLREVVAAEVAGSPPLRAVKMVFVVSDSVVDVRHGKSFALLSLKRRDGAELVLRLATPQDAKAWVIALATKSEAYRRPPNISDFAPISPIGRGASGKVFLVRDTRGIEEGEDGGERLALKIINKHNVFRSGLTYLHVVNERLVLEATADSPFLVHMRYAFQTEASLCVLTEFYDGGDVFALLQANGGRLAERYAARVLGEVILAIESLHEKNIVYRDLKPENVVLDREGHIRLADFGLAKVLTPVQCLEGESIEATTKTICGTTAYAAPEMLLSRPYSKSLDMWCLGVFMYHIMTGRTPYNFKNKTMPEMKDLQHTRAVRYPSALSAESVAMMKALLQLDPDSRPSIREIKPHPFFRHVDWAALYRKEPHPDSLSVFVSGAEINDGRRKHGNGAKVQMSALTQSSGSMPGPMLSVSDSAVIGECQPHDFPLGSSMSFARSGIGSSLRTNSTSEAGSTSNMNLVDLRAIGEEEDSTIKDQYLLRNINQEEWRTVSFAQDKDTERTVTSQFPMLFGTKAKEIETVCIAGWSYVSSDDLKRREEAVAEAVSIHQLTPDRVAQLTPRPIFGRRSLPETFQPPTEPRVSWRRSMGDRFAMEERSAAPGGRGATTPAKSLFNVGAERQIGYGVGGTGTKSGRGKDNGWPSTTSSSPSVSSRTEGSISPQSSSRAPPRSHNSFDQSWQSSGASRDKGSFASTKHTAPDPPLLSAAQAFSSQLSSDHSSGMLPPRYDQVDRPLPHASDTSRRANWQHQSHRLESEPDLDGSVSGEDDMLHGAHSSASLSSSKQSYAEHSTFRIGELGSRSPATAPVHNSYTGYPVRPGTPNPLRPEPIQQGFMSEADVMSAEYSGGPQGSSSPAMHVAKRPSSAERGTRRSIENPRVFPKSPPSLGYSGSVPSSLSRPAADRPAGYTSILGSPSPSRRIADHSVLTERAAERSDEYAALSASPSSKKRNVADQSLLTERAAEGSDEYSILPPSPAEARRWVEESIAAGPQTDNAWLSRSADMSRIINGGSPGHQPISLTRSAEFAPLESRPSVSVWRPVSAGRRASFNSSDDSRPWKPSLFREHT